ncbi:hypothetical protein HNP38_002313 [Chryseobacterium defluvii]|uniref:Nitrile hydratase alpha/Thiocyanate hydrolase gamma domain-containing protein n=1 Tax=Chryseobacterium defluvii TaxID=160396 RepID=A0A840KGB3_9FLAO|nr:nitrile hydratase subunit alpha [Chryseobacterium defluvii]MBB4807017.1 hypothetical protein [Chryseobacterium defluvii]
MKVKETSREVLNRVTVKAWTNPEYMENLINNPTKILEEEGFQFPKRNSKVIVHINTDEEIHVVIPTAPEEINFSKEDILKLVAQRLQIDTDPG